MINFHPLEVVDRETQLQVGDNWKLNNIAEKGL